MGNSQSNVTSGHSNPVSLITGLIPPVISSNLPTNQILPNSTSSSSTTPLSGIPVVGNLFATITTDTGTGGLTNGLTDFAGLQNSVSSGLNGISNPLSNGLNTATQAIGQATNVASGVTSSVAGNVTNVLGNVTTQIGNVSSQLTNAQQTISSLGGNITTLGSNLGGQIAQLQQQQLNSLSNGFNTTAGLIYNAQNQTAGVLNNGLNTINGAVLSTNADIKALGQATSSSVNSLSSSLTTIEIIGGIALAGGALYVFSQQNKGGGR